MKNEKALRFFLMLFCFFLLSLIFTAFNVPFSDTNSTPFDLGHTTGVTFRNMFKISISVSICHLVYRKLKVVSE